MCSETGTGVPERNGCADSFSPSVMIARKLYGCDLCERLLTNPRMAGMSLDRQHGHPITFPLPIRTKPVLVARAPMGSGKTTALIDWLTAFLDSEDKSAVIVSCRRSFTNSLSRRFQRDGLTGFTTYLDSDQYVLTEAAHRRLLVQLESLQRISDSLLDRYDVLVVDEVMSIVAQFFSPTMRRLRLVDSMFTSLLRRCRHVIAMDATVNATLVELLAELRGAENVHVVVSDFVSRGFANRECVVMSSLGAALPASMVRYAPPAGDESREASASQPPPHDSSNEPCAPEITDADIESTEGSFFHELHVRLLQGENVCVFSSTLAFSRIVAFFCAEVLSPDAVLLLNSTSPPVDTSDWSRYKVVVYTTVVTVGLSFDDSHFHTMFAFVKPSIHGPDMMAVYQAMGRVRSLIRDRLFMYMDVSSANEGPTFTPMLLNAEIGSATAWPPEILIPANTMCLRFKDRCSSALLDHHRALFSRFKTKHYLERSTLTSANDSFSLLHTLLANNKIAVRMRGDRPDAPASAILVEDFGRFLSRLRTDAFSNRRFLRRITYAIEEAASAMRERVALRNPTAEETVMMLAENQAARSCMERFFGLRGAVDDYGEPIIALMKDMGDVPLVAARLVNAAVIEAGCACSAGEWYVVDLAAEHASHGSSEFDKWMNYYLDEPLVSLKRGRPEEVQIPIQPGIRGRTALLRACVNVARQIGWRPTTWNDDAELEAADVERAMATAIEAGLGKFALEYMRLNFTEPSWLTGPIRNLQRFLGARKRHAAHGIGPSEQRKESPEICIFRTLWAELFGVRILKSQRTFPGTTRVKNLRKEHLKALLDRIEVRYPESSTHKQLYGLLRENQYRFSNSPKLLLRTPDWMRQLSGNRPQAEQAP
ncbi:ICP9 [Psittacid alphaherpesvirus 1]|uniref:Replication origin-binding protein n=2 Tax=Psittacid alphaherpesvirus 1 TaxID=50294 RepID=OBP_PSHV1|nr:DNA replication origin-binding helicase [Psittacid alphaherpesvirus 1]Q6UDH3.1 RecName: Full=Replication origin-binding protein; Short=OBP; AltName: Full=OriBP [Psittacid herpesvirus 1 Amazon parrot/1997]AAQ73737.1 ICP9 [Psittacid alphaherpesvirus 1]